MTLDFKTVTAVVESGILSSLASGVHAFVSDVRLISVIQGSQLDYGPAHLGFHWCLNVEWDDEACVGCIPCKNSSSEVLDIPASEVRSAKKHMDDDEVERIVKSVHLKFKTAPQKTLEYACVALNAVYGSSSFILVRQTMSLFSTL